MDKITLNIILKMADERILNQQQVDANALADSIQHWREQHPGFFQRIIGSMMFVYERGNVYLSLSTRLIFGVRTTRQTGLAVPLRDA